MKNPTRQNPNRLATLLTLVLVASSLAGEVMGEAEGSTILVDGGLVLTFDDVGTAIENGAVAVQDGGIVAVGPSSELRPRYPDAEVIDATGRIVMPGLVNSHAHVPMTLFRGIADDLKLMDWLEKHIFPAESRFVDEEFVRWGTRLACLEMLRGGVTTFADMYYFEDAIAEEVEACGMRGVLGQTVIDFPAPDYKTFDEAMAAAETFIERWKDHGRVVPAVAPHAIYTVSGKHLKAAFRLAEKHDVPYLIHVAESLAEIEDSRAAHGRSTVEYLAGLGVLKSRMLAAHVIWPTSGEIGLMADADVGVAHCPESNMKIAEGIAPVPQLLAAGVDVGLGTDGAASNNDLDLWSEMDTAAKLHKVAHLDPTVLPAETVLRMATRGGAAALGLGDVAGSLEVGKLADLIVVRTDGVHQTPWYDPNSLLVYSTHSNDVETVLVDGRIVVRDGVVLTVDEASVRAKASEYRDRIRAAASAD